MKFSVEQEATLKFLAACGEKAADIHQHVLEDSCLAGNTVQNWVCEFKRRVGTENKH